MDVSELLYRVRREFVLEARALGPQGRIEQRQHAIDALNALNALNAALDHFNPADFIPPARPVWP